jgi:hypothetical protein
MDSGKNPRYVHRQTFSSLRHHPSYAQYELPNPEDPTAPQIRLQEGCPSFKNIETNRILLLCLHRERFLVMDLLTQVFTTKQQAKFVPFSLPQNMAIRNPEEAYSNLLKQQTQFLNNQFGIPVVGLGPVLNQILPSNDTLKNIFLSTQLFTSIKRATQTDHTGKWIFITTRKDAAKAIKYIYHNVATIANDWHPNRNRIFSYPNPARFTKSPVDLSYLENTSDTAMTATKNQNSLNRPPRNAWRNGPEDSTLVSSIHSNATTSTLMLSRLEEHWEETNNAIANIQDSIASSHRLQTLCSEMYHSLQYSCEENGRGCGTYQW